MALTEVLKVLKQEKRQHKQRAKSADSSEDGAAVRAGETEEMGMEAVVEQAHNVEGILSSTSVTDLFVSPEEEGSNALVGQPVEPGGGRPGALPGRTPGSGSSSPKQKKKRRKKVKKPA